MKLFNVQFLSFCNSYPICFFSVVVSVLLLIPFLNITFYVKSHTPLLTMCVYHVFLVCEKVFLCFTIFVIPVFLLVSCLYMCIHLIMIVFVTPRDLVLVN